MENISPKLDSTCQEHRTDDEEVEKEVKRKVNTET